MKIGVNTFGLNSLLIADYEDTIKKVKEIGMDAIELCIVFPGEDPKLIEEVRNDLKVRRQDGGAWLSCEAPGRIEKLRKAGFQVEGAHVSFIDRMPERISQALPQMIKFAKENKFSYYVFSPMVSKIDEMKDMLPIYREAVKILKEEGIDFLFHNHSDELMGVQEENVFHYLCRKIPELRLELDVGWVHYAGKNAPALIKRYAERISILHFKDICEGACEENRSHCFTAVGEGIIPLKEILEEAKHLSLSEIGFVIDQDNSNGDMVEDLRKGLENINKNIVK